MLTSYLSILWRIKTENEIEESSELIELTENSV